MDRRSQPTMNNIQQPLKREPRAMDPRLPRRRGAIQNQHPLQSMEIQMTKFQYYFDPEIRFASAADEALNPLQHRQKHHHPPRLEICQRVDPRSGGIHRLEINRKQVYSLQKEHIKRTRQPQNSTDRRTVQSEATNMVHKGAHVDFSLARLSDEDCCSSCTVECLASAIPCGCAAESGRKFSYTAEGLLKAGHFMDTCVAMNKLLEKKHYNIGGESSAIRHGAEEGNIRLQSTSA
ncbi:Histone-lysine N-methyltransferase SUVR4 [Linum grandiflorum]